MSVFISYSRNDSQFVEKLSITLVQNKINVWLDKWAMKLGDSLEPRIQQALSDSSYLLVVLSKSSVESPWCKKELNTGLLRELEEKKIVVIPILLEDCEIPESLKDKLFADFTKDFNEGFETLVRPLSKLISEHMGRSSSDEKITDFAINWGLNKITDRFTLEIDTVTWIIRENKTILVQLTINGDKRATRRYKRQHQAGHTHLMKDAILNTLKSNKATKGLQVLCQNDKVDPYLFMFKDDSLNLLFEVKIRGVVMGVDSGDDTIVHLIEILDMLDSLNHFK